MNSNRRNSSESQIICHEMKSWLMDPERHQLEALFEFLSSSCTLQSRDRLFNIWAKCTHRTCVRFALRQFAGKPPYRASGNSVHWPWNTILFLLSLTPNPKPEMGTEPLPPPAASTSPAEPRDESSSKTQGYRTSPKNRKHGNIWLLLCCLSTQKAYSARHKVIKFRMKLKP